MAENPQATFTEVLELTADAPAFAKSLEELAEIYQQFVSKLGDQAGTVLGTGGLVSLKQEITALTETLHAFYQDVFKGIQDSVQNSATVLEKLDSLLEANSEKIRARAKKDAEEIANSTEEAQKAAFSRLEQLSESGNLTRGQRKFGQNLLTEFEGVQNLVAEIERKADAATTKLFEAEIAKTNKLVDKQTIAAFEEEEKLSKQLAQTEEQRAVAKQGRLYEELQQAEAFFLEQERIAAIEREQLALFEKEIAAQDKLIAQAQQRADKLTIASFKTELAGQDRSASRADADTIKAFTAEAEKYRRELQLARDISNEQERIVNEADAQTIRNLEKELALLDEQDRVRRAIAQGVQESVTLEQRLTGLQSNRSDALAARQAALQREYNAALEKTAALKAQINAEDRNPTLSAQQRLELQQQYNRQLSETAALQNQINGITSQLNVVHTSGLEKLKNMAVRIAEIYVLWNLVQKVVDGITAAIEAPITLLADGVKYLSELEEQGAALVGVLQGNVEFSKDLAENFKISQQAATEVAHLLREISATTGLPLDGLKRTFEALTASGAGASVKNVRELVELSKALELGFEGSGRNARQVQQIVSELPKFFNGSLQAGSALLDVLRLAPDQAQKLVAHTKEHRDLLEQVTERLSPFLTAAQQAEIHYTRVTNALKEHGKELEGLIAGPLFKRWEEFLRRVLDYYTQNKQQIQELAKVIGDVVDQTAQFLTKLFNVKSLADEILESFGAAVIAVSALVQFTATWVKLILDGYGSLSKFKSELFTNPLEAYKEIFRGMSTLKDDLASFGTVWDNIGKNVDKVAQALSSTRITAPKSAIDLPINDKGGRPSLNREASSTGVDKAEFERDLAAIKEQADAQRQLLKNAEDARVLTRREGAAAIRQLDQEELGRIDEIAKKYAKRIEAEKDLVDKQQTLNKEQKDAAKSRLDAEALRLETEITNLRKQLNADTENANRAGIKEQTENRLREFQNELALRKQQRDADARLAAEQEQAGFLTHIQLLDRKAKADKEAHDDEVKAIDEQIGQYGASSDKFVELTLKRIQIDRAFKNAMVLNAAERANAVEREDTAIRQFALNLQELANQAKIVTLQIKDALAPFQTINTEVFRTQNEDLNAKIKEISLELQIARAKNEDVEATRRLTEALKALNNQRLQLLQTQLSEIDSRVQSPTARGVFQRQAIAEARINATVAGPGPGETPEEFDARLRQFDEVFEKATPSIGHALENLQQQLFGFDLGEALDNATTKTEKFAVGLEAGANALGNLQGIVSAIQNGVKQGGVLGGIGAGIQQFSGVLSAIPVVGQFLPAIGGILSFVGGLFTAAAKRIAEDIKKSFQQTVDNYQKGNTTLVDTINTIEQERADAIRRLSGKKGGKDELDKLLPEIDRELDDLKKRQKDILDSFNDSLGILRLHSDTLGQINKQWSDINKQIKDYIGAGGSAADAAEFLSLQLQKMRENAADELAQAEQDAIQEALQLNDLLQQRNDLNKQRNQLQDDYNKKRFDLINADAIERRQAGAVTRGKELVDLEKQHTDELKRLQDQQDSLTQQITLTQKKVDKEREVFSLATDTATLRRRDEELTLESLDKQIQKYRDLQAIVKGITLGTDGQFVAGSGLFISPNAIQVQVTVTNNPGSNPVDGEDLGRQLGDGITSEIQRQMRLSPR